MTASTAPSTTLRVRSVDPIYRTELEAAAFSHGYRKPNGEADGWLVFYSDEGVPGEVALASGRHVDGGPWFLAVEHPGVARKLAEELPDSVSEPVPHTYRGAFAFADRHQMRDALSRAFHLARGLPSFPLSQYEAAVAGLGDTETERLTKQRIGQGFFRDALINYWRKCPITGVSEPRLLRASHIVPWSECRSDEERLSVHNGLLLAAHWDAAFDQGLVSFDDEGRALVKPGLDPAAAQLLDIANVHPLPLEAEHRLQLAWHRQHFGFET